MLADVQHGFADAIDRGPGSVRPGDFAMSSDRLLLAFRAHANSVNYARIVALEDSFPLLRAEIGAEFFHRLAQSYVDTTFGHSTRLAAIGDAFPDWLTQIHVPMQLIELARLECAFLQSYHAADAEPLAMSDLAGCSTRDIASLQLARHPAARLIECTEPLAPVLANRLGVSHCAALMTVRPEFETRLVTVSRLAAMAFDRLHDEVSVENMLAGIAADDLGCNPFECVAELIAMGALIPSAPCESRANEME